MATASNNNDNNKRKYVPSSTYFDLAYMDPPPATKRRRVGDYIFKLDNTPPTPPDDDAMMIDASIKPTMMDTTTMMKDATMMMDSTTTTEEEKVVVTPPSTPQPPTPNQEHKAFNKALPKTLKKTMTKLYKPRYNKSATTSYTSNNGITGNAILRGLDEGIDEEKKPYFESIIKGTDETIRLSLKFGRTNKHKKKLYRGCRFDKMPEELTKEGSVFTDKGFFSTSTNPKVAVEFSTAQDDKKERCVMVPSMIPVVPIALSLTLKS